MGIRVSNYWLMLLSLFVTEQVLAIESISRIHSLQGQVLVQRGEQQIEANTDSDIYFGDSISTSNTGKLGIQLWSQLRLKLDADSKITIIPGTYNTEENTDTIHKIIKLDHGTSCIEVDHLLDSPVLFQMGIRVTANFIKPAELCLSTDVDESHIQLNKGSVELMQLTSSKLIGLNEPGSEISFYDDGSFKLVSASTATPQVIPTEEPKKSPKTESPKASFKTDHRNRFYNVYLYASRSYDSSETVNQRLRDSGYKSIVLDEVDDKGHLFRVTVPGFETLTAARVFVDKVAVALDIHDAWVARQRPKK
jgi:hypothetical protein